MTSLPKIHRRPRRAIATAALASVLAGASSCQLLVPLDGISDGGGDTSLGGAASTGGADGTGGDDNSGGSPSSGGTGPELPVPQAPPACPDEPAFLQELFVSDGGDDSAVGTASAPVKSITRALELATQGTVVRVGAGSFPELTTLVVPEGVSLVGAGSGKTTVTVETGPILLELGSAKSSEVRGLRLDGRGRQLGTAIHAVGATKLAIVDVHAHNFSDTAVRIERGAEAPSELTVCGSRLLECGSSNESIAPYVDLGCLHVDPGNKFHFYDLEIETALGSGIRIDGSDGAPVSDILIEYVSVKVPAVRNNGGAPQYALTLRNVDFQGAIVRESYFNGLIAFWQAGDGAQQLLITRNTFEPQTTALELDANDAEISYNLFTGGYYALFNLNSSAPRTGDNVHHNVFDGQIAPHPLLLMEREVLDFRFVHNTVRFSGNLSGTTAFQFSGGGSGHLISNNLFVSTATTNVDEFGLVAGSTIEHNLFYGIDALEGDGNVTLDPEWTESPPLPDPYFRLSDDSAARGVGAPVPHATGTAPVEPGACVGDAVPCVGWNAKDIGL